MGPRVFAGVREDCLSVRTSAEVGGKRRTQTGSRRRCGSRNAGQGGPEAQRLLRQARQLAGRGRRAARGRENVFLSLSNRNSKMNGIQPGE